MYSAIKTRSSGFALGLVCAVLFLLTCTSTGIVAQTVVGRISGTITDAAGAVVPSATVTATNTATNSARTVTADDRGFYTVTNLPAGIYTVSAEQANFKRAVQQGISVTADARLTVDVTLEAGQVSLRRFRYLRAWVKQ